MVAGILEKSKRLRKMLLLFIGIQELQYCKRNRWLRETADCGWRVNRAAVMINLGNTRKYVRARRDITPRRRQIERAASVEMYVSAPVSKACFRPAAAEQLPNPFHNHSSTRRHCLVK
jgi:hypothetical protein